MGHVNREMLAEDFEDDEDILMSVIGKFINDLPKLLGDIEGAIQAGEASKVQLTAHSFKGAVSNFRVDEAAAKAQEIEHDARVKDISQAPEKVAALKTLMQDVKVELQEILDAGKL